MAITWKITGFEVTNANGLDNEVTQLHWWAENQLGNGNTVWARGIQRLDAASASSFLSFSSITSVQALDWLDSHLVFPEEAKVDGFEDHKDKLMNYLSASANATTNVTFVTPSW